MAEQRKISAIEDQEPDLDSLLKPLGGFGKFQIINILCMCSIIIVCSFSELGYVFTAGSLKHRCLVPECESANASWDDAKQPWLPYAIPGTTYDSCLRYNNTQNKCTNDSFTHDKYQCDTFVYESEEWTIAREDWGMQCDGDKYLLSLMGSLNNAGQVIGALYVGYLSDRFGRKVVIVTLACGVSLLGLIKSFSVNYAMMATFEVLEASMGVALFNGPFVLALEIVDPSKRVLAGTLTNMVYPVGEMILGLVQYLTLNWRTTIRILYTPFVLVLAYYWFIPESARWLLDNHRPDEAVVVLKRIAKINGRALPEQQVKQMIAHSLNKKEIKNATDRKNKFLELWLSKTMRYRVIANHFVWLCSVFVYFGMTMNSVSVSNDKFLNFILTGLIEIPAYGLAYFSLGRWKRRVNQTCSLLLSGLACLLDAYVPDDDSWSWAKLLLYLIGKFGISISMFTLDVYTTEMFPTSVRSTMMSTGLLVGKLATIAAPEVPLLSDIYEPLPLLIFGTMATAGSIVALTFPETLNCKLPDTVEEAENLGRKHKGNKARVP